ncbi:DUF1403 family protein (plasmid) [Shinella oryzae]|nr:DUF1403 family protein [Shinella oryzae]
MAELADLLGLAWDDRLTAALDHADEALKSGRPAPFAAADLVTAVHAVRPDAEPLAWMLADMLIAALPKWDCAVPLLMAERYGPAFKTLGGLGPCAPGGTGLCPGRYQFPRESKVPTCVDTSYHHSSAWAEGVGADPNLGTLRNTDLS